ERGCQDSRSSPAGKATVFASDGLNPECGAGQKNNPAARGAAGSCPALGLGLRRGQLPASVDQPDRVHDALVPALLVLRRPGGDGARADRGGRGVARRGPPAELLLPPHLFLSAAFHLLLLLQVELPLPLHLLLPLNELLPLPLHLLLPLQVDLPLPLGLLLPLVVQLPLSLRPVVRPRRARRRQGKGQGHHAEEGPPPGAGKLLHL